jgi:hypothetical protein
VTKAGLAHDTLYTTVYARISTLPPANKGVIVLRGEDANGNMMYQLFFYNKAGTLTISLAVYTPSWARLDYTLSYTANTWYCLKVEYSRGASGEVRFWVNGVEAGARTGINTTGLRQQDHVVVGQVDSSYATSVWVDDVTVNNTP